MPTPTEGDIKLRSYLLWEREGRPIGRDWEHWFRAERDVQVETTVSNAVKAKPAKRKPPRPRKT